MKAILIEEKQIEVVEDREESKKTIDLHRKRYTSTIEDVKRDMHFIVEYESWPDAAKDAIADKEIEMARDSLRSIAFPAKVGRLFRECVIGTDMKEVGRHPVPDDLLTPEHERGKRFCVERRYLPVTEKRYIRGTGESIVPEHLKEKAEKIIDDLKTLYGTLTYGSIRGRETEIKAYGGKIIGLLSDEIQYLEGLEARVAQGLYKEPVRIP